MADEGNEVVEETTSCFARVVTDHIRTLSLLASPRRRPQEDMSWLTEPL